MLHSSVWALLRLWHALCPTRKKFIVTTIFSQRFTSHEESLVYKDWRGIPKSIELLVSDGLLTTEEAHAVSVLAQAKGNGRTWKNPLNQLNLQRLNTGNKGILELFEEIRKGEARLRLRPHDRRFRRIAKRIRVYIRDKSGRLWLREVGRKYYNAAPKYATKLYAVTGCIMDNELKRIQLAAQREVAQELDREYPLENFKVKLPEKGLRPDEHESDAYRGGTSVNYDYDVELTVDPWPEEWMHTPPVIKDTCIEVFVQVMALPRAVEQVDDPIELRLQSMLSGEEWTRLDRA